MTFDNENHNHNSDNNLIACVLGVRLVLVLKDFIIF